MQIWPVTNLFESQWEALLVKCVGFSTAQICPPKSNSRECPRQTILSSAIPANALSRERKGEGSVDTNPDARMRATVDDITKCNNFRASIGVKFLEERPDKTWPNHEDHNGGIGKNLHDIKGQTGGRG